MSTFKVSIEKVVKVDNHPNADKLDIIQVLGWNLITAKNNFKEGDLCIYFPIDSILSSLVEIKLFGEGSKIKLSNHRIRTIKLRGAISQGLAAKFDLFKDELTGMSLKEGVDLTSKLDIKKYDPPTEITSSVQVKKSTKKSPNTNFKKYTDIENYKNYTNVFSDNDDVVVTEKIHGSNWRAGKVKTEATTLWKKVLKFLRLLPKYEFVIGSHNIQLQDKIIYKGYYDKNVYSEMIAKYKIKDILKEGYVMYGEVYGDGIQKGYTYGCDKGERRLVLFDVMKDGRYLNFDELKEYCINNNLQIVPLLYEGKFNADLIETLKKGQSILNSSQKVREGVVVKSFKEEQCYCGRKILKFINDEYLLKNQDNETEAH